MSIFGDKDDDFELFSDSNGKPKESRTPPVRTPRPPVSNQQTPKPPVTPRPEPRVSPQNSGRVNTGTPQRARPAPVAPSRGLPPKPAVPTRSNIQRTTPSQNRIPAYTEPVEEPQIMRATETAPVVLPDFDEQYYDEQAVEQDTEYSTPAYIEPEPEYVEPAYVEPAYVEPVYTPPEPTYREPAPVYVEPTPVYREAMREMEPAQYSDSDYTERSSNRKSSEDWDNASFRDQGRGNQSRNQTREVEQIDEDDFDEVIVNNRRSSSNTNKGRNTSTKKNSASPKGRANSKKKSSKKEVDYDKPVSRFFGGRRRVLINNISLITIGLLVVGLGVKSIVAPPYIPSQSDVEAVVAGKMNVTGFDKDGGRPFVSAFAKEYFAYQADTATSNKVDRLEKFTTESIASIISSSMTPAGGASQAITGEPQIAKITAIDDANAIYNVGVKIGSRWMYVDIPVFYDVRTLSYAISGVPAFTPPTTVALPGESTVEAISQDLAVQEATEANIASFFKAWAASNSEGLSRYVTGNADAETRLGLQNSVYFAGMPSYVVEAKDEADPTAKERRAIAQVEWNNAAKNPTVKYTQTFELQLYKQPDDRWYVADITTVKEPLKPAEITTPNAEIIPAS